MKNSFEQITLEKELNEERGVPKIQTEQRELGGREEMKTQQALKETREKIRVLHLQGKDTYHENLQKELSENSEVKQLYEEIILNENPIVLKEKTSKQIEELSRLFFKYPKIFHIRYNLVQKEKLKAFVKYVEALKPIRSDNGNYDEFKCPELTGNLRSYGGLDPLVKAERYVYASFDKMTHQMSGKLGVSPNTVELSDYGFEDRAQIVMNDIANVSPRALRRGEGLMEKYLTNLFDYEGGKKILSFYLALVFDDPRDIEYTFDGSDSRLAQLWDEDDDFSKLGNDYNLQRGKTTKEANEILETVISEKRRRFGRNMRRILQETGIEPPCSLELRIRDSVKSKKVSEK